MLQSPTEGVGLIEAGPDGKEASRFLFCVVLKVDLSSPPLASQHSAVSLASRGWLSCLEIFL